MTKWILADFGTREFNHEGWTVRIWERSQPSDHWISVQCPTINHEVIVRNNELSVECDESSSIVDIPWPVIIAIVEAREIVARECAKLKQNYIFFNVWGSL